MPSPTMDAAGAYASRRDARRARAARLELVDRRIADLRLAVVVLGLGGLYFAAVPKSLALGWLALPVAAFVALAVWHERVIAAGRRAALGAEYYDACLRRLAGDTRGAPSGADLAPADHPYAADLDLFGEASLFALLCRARTRAGERALADWLLAPARPEVVALRQEAVRELSPKLELTEELFLLGAEVREAVRPERLTAWAEAPRRLEVGLLAAPLLLLAAANLAALLRWALGGPPLLFLVLVLATWAVRRIMRAEVQRVIGAVEEPGRELRVLSRIMGRLEREPARALAIVRLQEALGAGGAPASRQVGRLARLVELADAERNQLFAPVAFLLVWGPLFALAIEAWRRRAGVHVAAWLRAVGELEALCSLAGYAFDHPHDAFAELGEGDPRYEALGLTHPLLAEAQAVRNDLALGADAAALVIISGSNMSGKSTLLRSVGVSVVMALAGAPSRATRLCLSPLSIGASLRVVDSLAAGRSRFYAEIHRIAALLREADDGRPVLFLFDEILHGTNSHDRLQGARALLAALLARRAIGLVTTHDLAITALADELPRARNAHLVDALAGTELTFDYRLREGVVQKSNAIELMRAIGLPV